MAEGLDSEWPYLPHTSRACSIPGLRGTPPHLEHAPRWGSDSCPQGHLLPRLHSKISLLVQVKLRNSFLLLPLLPFEMGHHWQGKSRVSEAFCVGRVPLPRHHEAAVLQIMPQTFSYADPSHVFYQTFTARRGTLPQQVKWVHLPPWTSGAAERPQ